MKKKDNGLRAEYDFHRLKVGVKGKYAIQYGSGINLVYCFTDYGDRIKEFKKKRLDIYQALKNPEPLACLA